MTSLNDKILDPKWLSEQSEKDPLMMHKRSFYLPGRAIKSDVKCAAQVCKWETRYAEGSTLLDTSSALGEVTTVPKCQPMMLCFCCNRTFHFVCIDDLRVNWFSQKVPLRCPECKLKSNNEFAVAFYKSDKWKKGLIERRKALLKSIAIESKPSLLKAPSEDEDEKFTFEKEDEEVLDSTLDSSAFISAADLEEIHKKEMEKLGNEMERILNEKARIEEELKKLKESKEKKNTAEAEKSFPSFKRIPTSTFYGESVRITTAADILSRVYLNTSKKSATFDKKVDDMAKNNNGTRASTSKETSGAGLTQPEGSSMPNINLSELDTTTRVLLEQAYAQREASNAQRDVSHAMKLEQQRKSLQKISPFNGDERDWIRFKRDIFRHKEVGEYDENSMKMYLLRALEGIAADRVRDLIDQVSFEESMKVLEETFGDPTRIINKRSEDILALKIHKDLYKDDVIIIVTKMQAYFAACSYANIDIANTNYLAKHIFDQLPSEHRQRCRRFHREENGGDSNKLLDLETLFKFLEDLMKDLDDKKSKVTQVNSTSYSSSSFQIKPNQKADRYLIKDIKEAKFMGYDMEKVNSYDKKCLCCNKNHFTVECKLYYDMEKNKRMKFVNDKGLCRNCVLTSSHRADECLVKPSCGLMFNGSRCNQKHHVSLHKSQSRSGHNLNFRRRNNTNSNTNRAVNIQSNAISPPSVSNFSSDANATISNAPAVHQLNQSQNRLQNVVQNQKKDSAVTSASIHVNPYSNNSINMNSLSLGNTVKVFKTKFLGEKGFVVGHSVGDSASETTLMSEELRQALDLEGENCQLVLRWADSTIKRVDAVKVDLNIKGVQAHASKLTLRGCYAVKSDDFCLPARSLNVKLLKRKFPYLKPVQCDSYFEKKPLLLIGSPHAAVIESCGQLYEGGEGKPVGLLAKLGWCVYGGDPDEMIEYQIANVQRESNEKYNETALTNEQLYESFAFFNSIENLGIKEKSSRNTEDEAKAIAIMQEEMKILPNGAFEVPLVWNRHEGQIPKLPNNFPMVLKRQMSHEKKLMKNPDHLKIYNEKFKELITEGYVRAATMEDLNQEWPNVNYLPMTLVINQNKIPVGYRIVFDAAAKYMQTSLNMHLLKGPDLLVNLYEPLMRMRTKQIAFTADIKAMFMRMKVNIRDQQCQRVLFRESPNDLMKVFVVSSVLFGPSCSPFQSQYCKNLVAEAWKDEYPEASFAIKNFMYMDDLLTSETSTEAALKTALNCIEMFANVNWHLVSFQSNDLDFLKGLPSGNVKQEVIPLMEDVNQVCAAKVLGCMWDTKSDNFIFNFDKNLFIKIVTDCEHKPTKRDQSSTIARIFDVLGFLSHLVIRGRILLQRSWQQGIDWDQQIPDEEQKEWLNWLYEIESAASIKIPRKLCQGRDLWESEETSLHLFCDAGCEAYAAVAYLVTMYNGKRSSRIIMARAKVTPLRYKSKSKVTEIPRLELFAALCSARLCETISKCFPNLKFSRYLWSDSEVVLKWIKNPNMHLKPYAVSPIDEILSKTDKLEWFYVPSKLNVADIATKFRKFDFSDSNSLWFSGPEFILSDKHLWPVQSEILPKVKERSPEEDILIACNVSVAKVDFVSPIKLPHIDDPIANENCIDKLPASIRSTWIKLVRATARGLKVYMDGFIPLIRSKKFNDRSMIKSMKDIDFNILTAADLDRAELFLIRRAQRKSIPEEYNSLLNGKPIVNKEMQQLGIFVDDQGVLRINSRVKLSQSIYPQRFNPFLPRENPYTRIYLYHVHYEYEHIHLESQIAAVRARVWIPSVRVALKSIQYRCNFCACMRARPYAPMMAPLPDCRTDPSQFPFQTTGLDCAGPIVVHIHGKPKKVWILIFSCTLTRFIQLFLLESLESTKVMEAIATLWSTNGPVQTFLSDRGTNFQGASRFIREEWERTKSTMKELHGKMAQKIAEKYKIDWKFFPAHSPWMGGFYERLIKEVKRSIALTLDQKKVSKTELNIALQDACHRINCRPLTHIPVDSDDGEILTPHHLARGRAGWPYLPAQAPASHSDIKNDRSVYRRGRMIADEIMRKFVTGYLVVLTKRTKWFTEKTKPLQINDLVFLIEPNMTRREWKRGRILKIYKSSDRRGRVADVLLTEGVVKIARSIQRLAKIEIQPRDDDA